MITRRRLLQTGILAGAGSVLPAGFPATPIFGYGSATSDRSFRYPGPTIEATAGRPVSMTWANQLVSRSGRFRPHLWSRS